MAVALACVFPVVFAVLIVQRNFKRIEEDFAWIPEVERMEDFTGMIGGRTHVVLLPVMRPLPEVALTTACRNVAPFLGVTPQQDAVYVTGSTLKWARQSLRDSEHNFKLACGVASGLAHLHSLGLVHGRLTIDAVAVNRRGEPLLVFYGAAHYRPVMRVSNSDEASGESDYRGRVWTKTGAGKATHAWRLEDEGCETFATDNWSLSWTLYQIMMDSKEPCTSEYEREAFMEKVMGNNTGVMTEGHDFWVPRDRLPRETVTCSDGGLHHAFNLLLDACRRDRERATQGFSDTVAAEMRSLVSRAGIADVNLENNWHS